MNETKKYNVICDLDGTLCQDIPNETPEKFFTAEPIREGIAFIDKLYKEGHNITIFTARPPSRTTKDWLALHGVRYHNIIFSKPRITETHTEYMMIDNHPVRGVTTKGGWKEFVKKTATITVIE